MGVRHDDERLRPRGLLTGRLARLLELALLDRTLTIEGVDLARGTTP